MFEFKLPDLGEGIHEGEILQWHVGPGDQIDEDAPLVDVETDKAAVTIPSPRAGTVVSVHGEPGQVVEVGQVIAVINAEGEATAAKPPRAEGPSPPLPESGEGDRVATEPPGAQGPSHPVPAAPATRRLARELEVDIDQVPPTGPAGRVTPEDVRAFAEGRGGPAEAEPTPRPAAEEVQRPEVEPTPRPATEPALPAPGAIPYYEPEPMPDFERWGPVEREPLRSIRRKIARKMVTSLVVVPHVIHMDEADVTELEALRLRYRERRPDARRISLLSFVVTAVTAGLKRARMFNASLDPDRNEIVYKTYYNIGLAADTPKGLIVPVVKGADRKSVLEISGEISDLAQQARDGEIGLEDLQGGTFTITNVGPLGGIALAPAINYPEVAILGMGRAQEKPVVRDGEIVIRKMLPLTLSFDHRVADGADAARFVTHVIRLLSDPESLLLEG